MRLPIVVGVCVLLWAAVPAAAAPPRLTAAVAVEVAPDAARTARAAGVDLKQLVETSARRAAARLPQRGRVTIRVQSRADATIPELGVGGYTDPAGDVWIAIDPAHAGLGKSLSTWIPSTVAHELHHSSRLHVRGYGRTLAGAIVSEGLADRFAEEVFPGTPPSPWSHALTKAQERTYWRRAKPLLEREGYDHVRWFFGTPTFPRWVGYSLGWEVTGRYLRAHRLSAADAVGVDAAAVVTESASL